MGSWIRSFRGRKRRGFIFTRKPYISIELIDSFHLLGDEYNVYLPRLFEDFINLCGICDKNIKRLDLDDKFDISDNVLNTLSKLNLQDEIVLSVYIINTLNKIELEDSFYTSGHIIYTCKPIYLDDMCVLSSSCVKAFESSLEHSLEDEFVINGGLYKAFENILTINVEDSLNISDSLIDMRLRLMLEDTFNISDSLKSALAKISLEDSININDSLTSAIKSLALEDSINVSDNLSSSVDKRDLEDSFNISDNLNIYVAETEDEICDFMNLVTNYEYDYINVFFIRSKRISGYYYMVLFIDGRDTTTNKHYYICYTRANEIYTHCEGMIDYNCSKPEHCLHDYADEGEFVGAVCGNIDWVVLLYQAGKNITITPKYVSENIIDICGYERPAWSHFKGFVIHKNDGTKEYKNLEEITIDYNTIKKIAFKY